MVEKKEAVVEDCEWDVVVDAFKHEDGRVVAWASCLLEKLTVTLRSQHSLADVRKHISRSGGGMLICQEQESEEMELEGGFLIGQLQVVPWLPFIPPSILQQDSSSMSPKRCR